MVPRAFHALAAGLVIWCAWLALRHPDVYSAAMQEDRAVEWATVCFFVAAGALMLVRALRRRRVFDALVGLFCVFFAGEEMSWGQRLFGMTPPAYFLEHNRQQELNVHNFSVLFSSPKWLLMAVLVGFCAVLPLIALTDRGRRLLSRVGATPPPAPTIPWFVAAIILLYWYPFRFTGEWVELLVGATFFVASGVPTVALLASSAGVGAAALALSIWSSRGTTAPERLACATAEVQALAGGLANGGALPDLIDARSVHKRLWTLWNEAYVDFEALERRLMAVPCAGKAHSSYRRRYGVDPWGTAYWVRTARTAAGSTEATVYSFGPNRRRDSESDGAQAGDDVIARVRLSAK